jgi:hypothetical protein
VEKSSQKLCATSVIFKALPKVNNRPNGEISPNLVTLVARHAKNLPNLPNLGFENIRSGNPGDRLNGKSTRAAPKGASKKIFQAAGLPDFSWSKHTKT